MFDRRTDRIAESVRLLAAAGAVIADPTLASALKAGPGAYEALKKLAIAPPPGVARLADTLGAEARALFDATRDLPPDAEVLYPQMVEAGLVFALEVVQADMDAAAVTEAMIAKLTAPEHRTGAMLGLFRALTTPTLARMLGDNAFADDLRARFMQEVLRRLGDLNAQLQQVGRLTRLEMEALGNKFELAGMHALSDPALREVLEKKAEEYRDYRARIEAIDERTAGLGDLKAAAREAAKRLDFDEVEALLARVDAVETEIAAETKLLRADNALLRGRVKEAFIMLSAAADGFRSVGPAEPARYRLNHADRLYDHGVRYGGAALKLSERLIRRSLEDLSEAGTAEIYANGQLWLGIALTAQGERVGGETGAALLGEAVTAFHAALRVWTEAAHPENWARTQSNLGTALRAQGARVGGEVGAALIGEAVTVYRDALRVWTEAAHSTEWAMTQNNLGIALRARGERLGGEAGAALLSEAVTAFRAAQRVWTEAAHPVEWATTQTNIGTALAAQGAWLGGEVGAALIGEAVGAFRAAQRVWTEAAYPVYWAATKHNLALALEKLAANKACLDPRATLEAAEDALAAALRILDPEHMPNPHASACAALARVRRRLGRDCA